ncbi:hypothetical protein JOE58_002498 [Curtobacterium luteum]|uniref:Transmembrane protein n=1 Tax=Curtobacterium luteum TaxID=33881 RepID=A0A8H9G8N6_9MICO|nr:hypothetical protein [Curtobacterium luteum]MBM7803247.1 hypothetical protein [Curtobacterium luteum]NUU50895.1 hypothetical protein [Curtobacterium luteum]GGK95157.1 hypothetical protein GCM10009769_11550 [Curtobacterium luteum]
MASPTRRAPLSERAALWNLTLIWVLTVVGLLAAIGCAGYVFNENLVAYNTCAARSASCSDAGWFTSMGVTLVGGFGAVLTGGAAGVRVHHRSSGVWWPLAGLGVVLLSTAVAVVLLKALTGT